MSSTGQIVGGIVGGVIGFYAGGPAGAIKGAAIGASIGGYVDPPPGPNLYGPTLDDKSFQSTAYGVSLATLHGSIATTGNIIYLENNEYKAVARKESTGGKGGGSQGSYTTTTYYATFAVALGEAMPGSRVRRIWLGGKLVYSLGIDDDDPYAVMASLVQSKQVNFTYYDGSQTEPDSRMESVIGSGRCPSYEGTAYIMFYDLDLTDYGNGLAGATVKVEIIPDYDLSYHPFVSRQISLPSGFDGFDAMLCTCPMGQDGSLLAAWGVRPFQFNTTRVSASIAGESLRFRQFSIDNTAQSNTWEVMQVIKGASDSGCFYAMRRDNLVWLVNVAGGSPISTGFDYGVFGQRRHVKFYVFGSQRVVISNLSNTWRIHDIVSGGQLNYSGTSDVPAVVVGEGLVVVPSQSPSGTALREYAVYSESLVYIRSFFSITPNISVDLAGIIVGNTIYQLDLSGGFFRLWMIDINTGSASSFLTDINPIQSPTYSAISFVGGLLAIFHRVSSQDGGRVHYFTVADNGIYPVSLGGVVEHWINKSGIDSVFYDVSDLDADVVQGYRFSGPGSSRGALSPLQVAYMFDLVETGYTLTAVKRGSEPDEVVPWQHLDARKTGDAPTVLIKRDYETDSQLPSRYSISYLDYNREYDTNTQYADFPSRRVNERNESLAIVMDAERAAQLADVLGNLAWVERNTFVFTVPQLYLGWRPGDVKTIELSPGNFATLRINDITYTEDQRLEINARLAEPAVYQSGATGVPAQPPSEVVPFVGPSVAVLMDIPMILDSTDIPGFVGAMYGAGSWPGGVLFRSIDSGQTYTGIQAFTGQATIGEALNVLGSDDGLIIDRSSELTIQPLAGTFDAITEEQMLTGQHYCAYGVDGRWEIIRYADSVLNGDGTRTLSTLIRGYRGTEWATGLHEIGDYVVLLDDPDNAFIGSDLSQLAIERLYKPVTVGQDLESAEPFEFTYQGVNLEPLSPVLPLGEIVSDDWVIEWTPRTRYSSNYWYTGTQPQNESVMAWEVDVLDGSTVVRTLSSSTPTVAYTEAQQIEDFGSAQSTIDIVIYQVSQRVGRGYPLEVTF